MPAKTIKRGKKYRVVENNGKLIKNKQGTPVDGGGHKTLSSAKRQADAININQRKK